MGKSLRRRASALRLLLVSALALGTITVASGTASAGEGYCLNTGGPAKVDTRCAVQTNFDKYFGRYNVIIFNRDSPKTRLDLHHIVDTQEWRVSTGTYTLLVFESGTFHKEGRLGWENWAFIGNWERPTDRDLIFHAR
ncbi:hypothetical protein ACFXKW_30665 [Streptomyces sp. NPDC059193]|uniref:hypothetical protein n=1 Tax=Streptomyces sp. NPDC059193 TaxID=3346763 RepID=UPI0036B665A3